MPDMPEVQPFAVTDLYAVYSTEYDSLLDPQMGLHPEYLAAAGDEPIDLLRTPAGELLIRDGHHRAVNAMIRGDKFIDARLHDFVTDEHGDVHWPTAPIPGLGTP